MGFAFIGNTNLTKGKLHLSTTEIDRILEETQSVIDAQETYFEMTVGTMYSDKSFAYVIFFQFNSKGECKFETIEKIGATLLVKNSFNNRKAAKYS